MNLRRWLQACAIRPRIAVQALQRVPRFWRGYREFRAALNADPAWELTATSPRLLDDVEAGGLASGHYFHQDLYVARRIFTDRPKRHIDVGSRVDGFVAHLATFRTVEYFDLRPINVKVPNVVFRRGDLMTPNSLPSCACDSVSCLHVIEHVGLGRYGDRLAPEGWKTALRTLAGMLSDRGRLYLSVPIGRQRIEFNAHRVFAPATIVRAAQDLRLTLEQFAWVDDAGALHNPAVSPVQIPTAAERLDYGCGIFEFRA